MTKAASVRTPEPATESVGLGEVCLLVLPLSTFKALSDAAQARNVSVAEFLGRAIDSYVKETK